MRPEITAVFVLHLTLEGGVKVLFDIVKAGEKNKFKPDDLQNTHF